MSNQQEEKPKLGQQIKNWFAKLIEDPIGTLVESAVWIFLLAIGLSIAAMFVRMGWNMVRGAWQP
jgi:hypothetical protein